MAASTPKSHVTWFLAILSIVAFALLHLIPPSKALQAGLGDVALTGLSPDGIAIRQTYTGYSAVDGILASIVCFFSAHVDGRDPATYCFSLWFLSQLCGLLVFMYWEAGKARRGIVRFPIFFGMLMIVIGGAVAAPLYFMAHILTVPIAPSRLPHDALASAKMLLPAIAMGYMLPVVALYFAPSWVTLDQKQTLAAVWQGFPIYVSAAYVLFRSVYASVTSTATHSLDTKTRQESAAVRSLKLAHIVAGLISTVAHWAIVVPSLFSNEPSTSFTHIFVPYVLHPYLPFPVQALSLPAYRLQARLVLHNDWLIMTVASFAFFAWFQTTQSRLLGGDGNIKAWLIRLTVVAVFAGPGAAFAMEAIRREEQLWTMKLQNHSAVDSSISTKEE